MPNVGFKLGPQENIDKIVNTIIEGSHGTFYLTSDTSRLYVGNHENRIVPVNAGIITVDQLVGDSDHSGLPSSDSVYPGNYYYAKKENVLCVFNGERWVQINSVVYNTGLTTDVSYDSEEKEVRINTIVTQQDMNEVEDTYIISASNGLSVNASSNDKINISVETPIEIMVEQGTDNTSAKLGVKSSLNKNGEDQFFNLKAGANVGSIVADGTDVTLNVNDTVNTEMSISLSNDDTNNSVTISTSLAQSMGAEVGDAYTLKGENGITVSADEDNMLSISAEKIEVKVTTVTDGAEVSLVSDLIESTEDKDKFNIISGNSNVTVESENNNIKISSKDTTIDSIAFTPLTSGFELSLVPSEGLEISNTIDPVVAVGKDGTVQSHYVNGTATLPVYSITETDALIEKELKLFNAMMYRGVVDGTQTFLPVSGVHVGDTYLIATDGYKAPDNTVHSAGTLAIANISDDSIVEDENGFIPEGYISWDYVTGSQVDTQYSLNAVEGGFTLTGNNGLINAGQFTIAGDSKDITVSSSASQGVDQSLTIAHKVYGDITATEGDTKVQEANNSLEFNAIDSIEVSNGHITSFTVKKITVQDTNASLASYTASVTSDELNLNKSVSVSQSIILQPSAGIEQERTASFSIESENENLIVNSNAGKTGIMMNLVWGSF